MKHFSWFTVVALLFGTGAAYGASGVGFSGAFSNGYLIPTVACSIGTVTLTGGGVPICPAGGATGTVSTGVNYGPMLSAAMQMPNGASDKAILMMASLETAITTDTLVASKGGNNSTSSASGAIVVTPSICDASGVNCGIAKIYPSSVTFQSQVQTLSASLAGLNCTANTTSGVITCTDPETIELLLSIGGAHSFNFLVDNSSLGAGTYNLHLGIMVTASASTNTVGAGAKVLLAVNAGSLANLVVQTQTPFNTIGLCGANTGSSPAPCGGGPF
ncbi:MAG TPA: hypothetical protein VGR73_18650 [Bryobacteraceae bacterium]|nr:hypothetical protein [Bryobacteraceae bacterium]